jgi:hypothetical protein
MGKRPGEAVPRGAPMSSTSKREIADKRDMAEPS